ncbi:hypothetical protein RY831_14680 [Noviherbaspirillum sp. CPCC 100848]|uniref:Uncharacterized protein n=1 Tax=Noviherbaspirillum album TaxID=3080276 RepID=A0ABU6JA45_9BURK|nr:hypothetical protein [Noviherbaspirillum sp. CPCC 100848]MEC4720405.1 hypothetical protein [Noviherbaspirillum sp. CPCC 100848]
MVALIVGIGSALVYANRDVSGNASKEATKAYVGATLKQAGDLRSRYLRFIANGGEPEEFLSDFGPNMATPHKALTTNGWAEWQFTYHPLVLPGIGTSAGERAVFFENLTEDACTTINTMLHGQAYKTAASTPAAGIGVWDFGRQGQTITPGVSGWDIGCLESTDNAYVFYAVVQDN